MSILLTQRLNKQKTSNFPKLTLLLAAFRSLLLKSYAFLETIDLYYITVNDSIVKGFYNSRRKSYC